MSKPSGLSVVVVILVVALVVVVVVGIFSLDVVGGKSKSKASFIVVVD